LDFDAKLRKCPNPKLFDLYRYIKKLGSSCRAVVMSIHQPSSETFGLFSQLCLLADGRLVYFGAAGNASHLFECNSQIYPPHSSRQILSNYVTDLSRLIFPAMFEELHTAFSGTFDQEYVHLIRCFCMQLHACQCRLSQTQLITFCSASMEIFWCVLSFHLCELVLCCPRVDLTERAAVSLQYSDAPPSYMSSIVLANGFCGQPNQKTFLIVLY